MGVVSMLTDQHNVGGLRKHRVGIEAQHPVPQVGWLDCWEVVVEPP